LYKVKCIEDISICIFSLTGNGRVKRALVEYNTRSSIMFVCSGTFGVKRAEFCSARQIQAVTMVGAVVVARIQLVTSVLASRIEISSAIFVRVETRQSGTYVRERQSVLTSPRVIRAIISASCIRPSARSDRTACVTSLPPR